MAATEFCRLNIKRVHYLSIYNNDIDKRSVIKILSFRNYLSSGYLFKEKDSYRAFQFRVLNYFMGVAAIFGLLVGVLGHLNVMEIGKVQYTTNYIYAALNIFLIWWLRQNKNNFKIISWFQVSISFLVFYIALISVPNDEFRLIWFYIALYLTYMLLGINVGFLFTVISIVVVAVTHNYIDLQLSDTAIYTAIFSLIAFSLLNRSYSVEIMRYENRLRTQNRELEDNIYKLDNALERANQSSRAKSLFLANMSHEIRTPMNGVLSMVQVLQTTQLDEQQQNYLLTVDRSGKTLLNLIDDLLDLSKIESGQLEIKNKSFKLWEFIECILNQVEPLFEESEVIFTVNIRDNLPEYMVGDEFRLNQIATNFVNNARKFTYQGEVQLLVNVDNITDTHGDLYIEVKDTGIGIPSTLINNIFEPFQQFSLNRIANKGVGLGLSICKKIAQHMDGELGVDSVEGKGSTFSFKVTLPLAQEGEIEVNKDINDIVINDIRILVVDDDPISRLAVKTFFSSQGHQVLLAKDGSDAIDQLEHDAVDIILMDIHMPVMDGLTATTIIKERELTQAPIIGMTASVMNDERESYFGFGIDALVEKPVNFEYLIGLIKEQLIK